MSVRAQKFTYTLASGGVQRVLCIGSFFKLLSATGAVKVESDFGSLEGLTTGQGLKDTKFSFLLFTDQSGGSNTITFLVADDEFVDSPLATVTVQTNKVPVSGAFTSAAKTVTNASGTLLAANANRQYFFVQNNDTAGDIYINLSGAAATVANSVKVKAGEDFGPIPCMPTTAITAIGSIASNANIVAVEG